MSDLVGLRLPEELYEMIAREAEASGNSMQSVIRTIIAKHYNRLPANEERKEQNELIRANIR